MPSPIVERIAAQTGVPRLFAVLAEQLSGTDLQSLLLEVYRARAGRVREAEALKRAERPLTAPSSLDARLLHRFDAAAFAAAAEFEALELSPVCPFGTTSVLGGIDQNNLLTALRGAEVLGDSTPVLALQCAARRRPAANRTAAPVRLCASHRMVRLQPVDFPGYTPHFRLFSLVSAGRDTGAYSFELRSLAGHAACYLRLFRALNEQDFRIERPLVEFSDLSMSEALLAASGVSPADVRLKVRAHLPGASERFLAERGIVLPSNIADPAELDGLARAHGLDRQLTRLQTVKEQVTGPLDRPVSRSYLSLQPRAAGRSRLLHRPVPAHLAPGAPWRPLSRRGRRLHGLDRAPAAGCQGTAAYQRNRKRIRVQALPPGGLIGCMLDSEAAMAADLLTFYESLFRNAWNTVTTTNTNWARSFSPTFYFGCNLEDFAVEHGVLSEVGSYGKQLNRVLDVLSVLVARALESQPLNEDERRSVDRFKELARRADEVASRLQNKPRAGLTQAEVQDVIERLRALERSDPAGYEALAALFREALGPACAAAG